MFAQLNLYAIIALLFAVIALGGGWYVSHRISTAEIDTLTQRNAVLTSAVETNEKTIAQMIADAQTLAAANTKLSHSIMKAEMEQAASWKAVEALGRELFVAATAIALPFVAPVYSVEEARAMMPSLTSRQFWMAAANIDIDKDVIIATVKDNMVDSVDRKIVRAELETSTFVRSSETIADIMAMLNIPAYQVDDLWTWAAGL